MLHESLLLLLVVSLDLLQGQFRIVSDLIGDAFDLLPLFGHLVETKPVAVVHATSHLDKKLGLLLGIRLGKSDTSIGFTELVFLGEGFQLLVNPFTGHRDGIFEFLGRLDTSDLKLALIGFDRLTKLFHLVGRDISRPLLQLGHLRLKLLAATALFLESLPLLGPGVLRLVGRCDFRRRFVVSFRLRLGLFRPSKKLGQRVGIGWLRKIFFRIFTFRLGCRGFGNFRFSCRRLDGLLGNFRFRLRSLGRRSRWLLAEVVERIRQRTCRVECHCSTGLGKFRTDGFVGVRRRCGLRVTRRWLVCHKLLVDQIRHDVFGRRDRLDRCGQGFERTQRVEVALAA